MLLNVRFSPAGKGLVSMVSSVIGWSVGMVIVRGKGWLTPGLKRRESSWGWMNMAVVIDGSVLPEKSKTLEVFVFCLCI